MNIFVTDPSPFTSARNLDNIRIVEQIEVVARLLSTVAGLEMYAHDLYTPYPLETPSVRWLRNDKNNFNWLLAYTYGLLAEFEERFCISHACEPVINKIMDEYGYAKPVVISFLNNAKSEKLEIDFSYIQDVPTAYQLYLTLQWNLDLIAHRNNPRCRLPLWTGHKPPNWYKVIEL